MQKKRIAVIVHRRRMFEDFIYENEIAGKYVGSTFVTTSKTYFIISRIEQCRGLEFDEVIELPGAYLNKEYYEIKKIIKNKL